MQKAFDSILEELLNDESIRQLASFQGRQNILLAVSGGVDSMTMAELFLNSSPDFDFALAHCNFGLRGRDSEADEALVTEWAEKSGVVLHKTRFDTCAYARENGISIEMAARDLRYKWFSALCSKHGYSALAVAHNANDNAETLLLNLLRGTGIKGLSGMGHISSLPDGTGVLIRPLLGFTRKQIEGYAFAKGVSYREDRTNAETEYKRNKLRNLAFPVFEQINPSFVRTLNREMVWFSQAYHIADDYFLSQKEIFLDSGRIDIGLLKSSRDWEYLLYRTLDEYGFNAAVISSLADLLKSGRTVSGKIFMSDKYRLITSSGYLTVLPKEKVLPDSGLRPGFHSKGTLPSSLSKTLKAADDFIAVHGPGNYHIDGISFSISLQKWNPEASPIVPKGKILFDRSAMDFPFICRKWREGDWFIPLGMKGKKKISDLFTDLKYSLTDKEKAVMIVNPSYAGNSGQSVCSHVSAVLGERIDNSLKVRRETKEVIIIETVKELETV